MSSSLKIILMVCTLGMLASTGFGQRGGSRPITDQKRVISTDALREMTKADSGNAIPHAGTRSTNTALIKELKDDFRSLQQTNNAMMGYVWGTNDVVFAKVSAMISDINKRAGRLKKNLALPEPPSKNESGPRPQISTVKELRTNLLMLDQAISDFVNSPLLRNPDVINHDSAEQASAALNRVIAISAALGKTASLKPR